MATPFEYLIFTPPTVTRTLGEGALFGRMRYEVGQTLLRVGESFVATENPSPEQIENADAVYIGGHDYHLRDQVEIARLRAAGYGDCLRQIKRRPYGSGTYGENNYGPNYS